MVFLLQNNQTDHQWIKKQHKPVYHNYILKLESNKYFIEYNFQTSQLFKNWFVPDSQDGNFPTIYEQDEPINVISVKQSNQNCTKLIAKIYLFQNQAENK